MFKGILIFAILANLAPRFGSASEAYFDKLSTAMNEAVNSRYSCASPTPDDYSENCSEVQTKCNYNDLRKAYDEATTVVNGICTYELARTHEGVSHLISVGALMLQMGKLSQNAVNTTRTQLYNLINLNNQNEVKCLIPRVANESSAKSGDFISTITTKVFTKTNNEFTENYKNCYNAVLNGETGAVNFSDPSAAAEEINSWFAAQTSFDGVDVVTVDDIRNDTGLVFTTCHNLEFEFENFGFSEQVDINFYLSKDNVTTLAVWKGEGLAKYSYNEQLQAEVVQLPLKGQHFLVIMKPQVGRIIDLLFYLRDNRNFAKVLAESKEIYLNLLLPLNSYVVRSEDYVLGLQLANQLTPMYYPDFDGFYGIHNSSPTYVSHMFHQMHMSIHGLGQNDTTTTTNSSSTNYVEINSGFAFYIINSSGIPVFCGTHLS